MNINEFAKLYFEGNSNKAIEHLALEGYTENFKFTNNPKNFDVIISSLSSEQRTYYVQSLIKVTKENPKKFNEALDNAVSISEMNLTYEEVQNAKVNPYKAKIGKSFFKFLVGTGGILAFMIAANNLGQGDLATKLGAGAMTLFNSYVALDVTSNIMNYFKFKNANKYVNEAELQQIETFEKGGKSL